MDNIINPRSILITGASSGIGAALARHYAQEGVTLFLCGRDEARLHSVAKECRQAGATVQAEIIDVTNKEAMVAWVTGCDRVQPLDLVIANAGISGGTGGHPGVPYGESPEQIRQLFDINLTGVLNTVDPALPLMTKRGCGQIALISSLASLSGWPGAPSYSASKGAVRIYGEALRVALAKSGVAINVILPGFIKTPMTAVNPYKMPFMISDYEAAKRISLGLKKNKGRIAFPMATYICAGLIGLLPYKIGSWLLAKFPVKPASNF